MVKNPHILEQFELEYERNNPLTIEQKLDLFEWMDELARDFGHFDSGRTGDDNDIAIKLSKVLNAQIQPAAGEDRAGS